LYSLGCRPILCSFYMVCVHLDVFSTEVRSSTASRCTVGVTCE
jgi:hypothetical protein